MPPPPRNERVDPPPRAAEATELAVDLLELALDSRLPEPPPVHWYEGPCLIGHGGNCLDGMGRRAPLRGYEIDIVRLSGTYGALAHELTHWGLHESEDDPDGDHDHPTWENLWAIEIVVDGLYPAD